MHSTLLGYLVISGWLVSKGDDMLPIKQKRLRHVSNIVITNYVRYTVYL